MAWSGILRFTDGISILENPQPPTVPNPATLAIAGGPDPLSHAESYLRNNDFKDGDHIRALGTLGTQGETTVIFMTSAQRIEFETADTDDTAVTAPPAVERRPSRKAGGAKKAAAKKAAAKKAAAKKGGAKKAGKSSKQSGAKKAAAKSGAGKSTKAAVKRAGKAPAKSAARTAKKAAASKSTKASAGKSSKKAPAKSTVKSAAKKGKKR